MVDGVCHGAGVLRGISAVGSYSGVSPSFAALFAVLERLAHFGRGHAAQQARGRRAAWRCRGFRSGLAGLDDLVVIRRFAVDRQGGVRDQGAALGIDQTEGVVDASSYSSTPALRCRSARLRAACVRWRPAAGWPAHHQAGASLVFGDAARRARRTSAPNWCPGCRYTGYRTVAA